MKTILLFAVTLISLNAFSNEYEVYETRLKYLYSSDEISEVEVQKYESKYKDKLKKFISKYPQLNEQDYEIKTTSGVLDCSDSSGAITMCNFVNISFVSHNSDLILEVNNERFKRKKQFKAVNMGTSEKRNNDILESNWKCPAIGKCKANIIKLKVLN